MPVGILFRPARPPARTAQHHRDSRTGALQPDATAVKSPLVIAALGAAASLALSVAMQQLLDTSQERNRDPLAQELEVQLAGRCAGAVRARRVDQGAGLEVELRLLAGFDRERIADTVAAVVWRRITPQDALREVTLRIDTEDGDHPLILRRTRPARRR